MSAPGLEVREDGRTLVATFPGSWLRVAVGGALRADQALSAQPGAVLVVNGPMFDARGPRFLLRDRAEGLDLPGRSPDEGVTVWVQGAIARAAYGAHPPSEAPVAVQGWPSLVVEGRVTASDVGTNAERDDRAGLGVLPDGRVIVVTLTGTMVQLAERMRREGAVAAGYLDGGSSLQARAGEARRDSPRAAPVPIWVRAEPPSALPDPAGRLRRLAPLGLALAGAAAAAGAVWWATRPPSESEAPADLPPSRRGRGP